MRRTETENGLKQIYPANKGIRTYLKAKIPVRFWSVLRFFDRYLIFVLYCWYLIRRTWYGRSLSNITSSLQQFFFTFPSAVIPDWGKNSNLSEIFRNLGVKFCEGQHSIYVYKKADIFKINSTLHECYPKPFGVKIIKSQEISPDGTPYYTSHKLAKGTNRISMRAVGSVKEKAFISNLLNLYNVAPRVYDIIKLNFGDRIYYAYVVQHIQGKTVTGAGGISFIHHLNQVLKDTGIEVLGIKEHCDFRPPEFRKNIFSDRTGTYYVDIQNFVLFNKLQDKKIERELQKVITKNKDQSYSSKLFYSVNSCSVMYKNEIEDNYISNLSRFLKQYKISLKRRNVIDIGCNLGHFIMFALNQGARWCVGIDNGKVIEVARQLLYKSGFTRFDMLAWHPKTIDDMTSWPFEKYDVLHFFSNADFSEKLSDFVKKFNCKILLYEGQPYQDCKSIISQIEQWPYKINILGCSRLKSGAIESNPIVLGEIQ